MEMISLTSINFQKVIETAAVIVKRGGVIVAPTDTVYGLLADATNRLAIEKVYRIKDRIKSKPLPLFVKNIVMAKKVALVSPKQQKFLEENWPGKITVILKRKDSLKIFGVNEGTIALRIPFNKFINSLLENLNFPLAGTSANISGCDSCTKIDNLLQQFADKKILPDMIINAGDLPESKPSTIVDLTQKETKILRV